MKATVAQLTQLPGVWRGGELEHAIQPVVATGHAALDRELPGYGWPTGTLTEVLHDAAGIGEISFLAGALARASCDDRLIAWIAPPHLPYAPALAAAGSRSIAASSCVRESRRSLWAAEQALRSARLRRRSFWLPSDEYAWLRRLQITAESGARWPSLFRSTAASASTPAHLRVIFARAGMLSGVPKRRGRHARNTIRLAIEEHPAAS